MDATVPPAIRALIVDDHKLFNDGLKAMLAQERTIEVVGQVYQSRDTPHAVAAYVPDVLLMDFNMPGLNGLDITRQLLRSLPTLKILILSMYSEQRYIDDFRKAGAKGYLLKTVDIDELVTAIQTIHAGNDWFNVKQTQQANQNIHANDTFIKRFQLTKREVEVIGHIRQGLTTQQIADVMNVSFYTAATHRRNIHLKLDVKSTPDLLRFMDENKG